MLPKLIFSILLLMSLMLPGRNGQRSVRVRYPWRALNDGYEKGYSRKLLALSPNRQTTTTTREIETKGHRNPMTNEKLNRKKVSARYQSVFGHSSMPLRGSEFVPTNIELYTGKLATSQRETFNWVPRGNIFLFPNRRMAFIQ